jgi:murein DD-endopeptidase MepM/ murein hydrolase activator NlpD
MVILIALALRIASEAPQGGVIRVEGAPANAAAAALQTGAPVRLFPAPDGSRYGLVPVGHDVKPGPLELTLRTQAGVVVHTAPVLIRSGKFPVQNIRATRAMKALKPAPGEMETMRALNETVTETRRWEETLAAPTPQCVNSPFGVTRLHNGKPTGNYHRGLDQASPAATPIRAAASGQVKVAKMFVMHGGTVGIDHGQGLTSHYLHMSRVIATEGQQVKQGDVIGEVGSTGFATGPHLHWGLYLFGVPVNARLWVPGLKSCPGPP